MASQSMTLSSGQVGNPPTNPLLNPQLFMSLVSPAIQTVAQTSGSQTPGPQTPTPTPLQTPQTPGPQAPQTPQTPPQTPGPQTPPQTQPQTPQTTPQTPGPQAPPLPAQTQGAPVFTPEDIRILIRDSLLKEDETPLWADSTITAFEDVDRRAYLDGRMNRDQFLRYWKHILALLSRTYTSLQSSDGKTIGEQELLRRIRAMIARFEGDPNSGAVSTVTPPQAAAGAQCPCPDIAVAINALGATLTSMATARTAPNVTQAGITQLRQEFTALQTQVAGLQPQNNCAELQQQVTQLQQELETARAQIQVPPATTEDTVLVETLTKQLSEANALLTERQAALDTANADVTKLTADLTQANTRVTDLEQQLTESETTLKARTERVAELQKQVDATNKTIADLQASLQQLQTAAQTAQAEVARVREELATAQASVKTLSEELTTAQTAGQTKEAENSALTKELSEARARVTDLEQELNTAAIEVQRLTATVGEQQTHIDDLNTQLKAAGQATQTSASEVTALRVKLEGAQKEIAALKAKIPNMPPIDPVLLGKLRTELDGALAAKITAEAELAKRIADAEKLTKDIQAVGTELDALAEELENARNGKQKAEADLADAAAKGAANKAKNAEIITGLRYTVDTATSTIEDLEARVNAANERITALEQQQAAADAEKAGLETQKAAAEAKVKELAAALEQARQSGVEKEGTETQQQARIQELEESAVKTAEEHQKALHSIVEESQKRQEESAQQIDSLRNERDQIQKELEDAKRVTDEKTVQIDALERTNESLRTSSEQEIKDLRSQNEALSVQIKTIEESNRQALNKASKNKNVTTSELNQINNQLQAMLDAANAAHATEKSTLESRLASLTQDIEAKTQESNQLRTELDTANVEQTQLRARISELEGQLASLNTTVSTLQGTLARKDKELVAVQHTSEILIAQSKANASAKEAAAISQLQAQLAAAKDAKKVHEDAAAQLSKQLESTQGDLGSARTRAELLDTQLKSVLTRHQTEVQQLQHAIVKSQDDAIAAIDLLQKRLNESEARAHKVETRPTISTDPTDVWRVQSRAGGSNAVTPIRRLSPPPTASTPAVLASGPPRAPWNSSKKPVIKVGSRPKNIPHRKTRKNRK